MAIVQLRHIGPRREVRVFAIRNPARPGHGFHRERASHRLRALHEQPGLLVHPRMIHAEMIRHEIQNEFQPELV